MLRGTATRPPPRSQPRGFNRPPRHRLSTRAALSIALASASKVPREAPPHGGVAQERLDHGEVPQHDVSRTRPLHLDRHLLAAPQQARRRKTRGVDLRDGRRAERLLVELGERLSEARTGLRIDDGLHLRECQRRTPILQLRQVQHELRWRDVRPRAQPLTPFQVVPLQVAREPVQRSAAPIVLLRPCCVDGRLIGTRDPRLHTRLRLEALVGREEEGHAREEVEVAAGVGDGLWQQWPKAFSHAAIEGGGPCIRSHVARLNRLALPFFWRYRLRFRTTTIQTSRQQSALGGNYVAC
eukprot:scaffold58972_cov63-Phaeocystis_antarctica.AAC.5